MSQLSKKMPFRRRVLVPLAAMVMTASIGSHALAQACLVEEEITSLHLEALRTELMVAALSCGTEIHYNAFIDRFRAPLISGDVTLAGLFQRLYGPATGSDHRDGFTTGLANRVSAQQSAQRVEFCNRADKIFTAAEEVSTGGIGPFAEKYSRLDRAKIQACSAG